MVIGYCLQPGADFSVLLLLLVGAALWRVSDTGAWHCRPLTCFVTEDLMEAVNPFRIGVEVFRCYAFIRLACRWNLQFTVRVSVLTARWRSNNFQIILLSHDSFWIALAGDPSPVITGFSFVPVGWCNFYPLSEIHYEGCCTSITEPAACQFIFCVKKSFNFFLAFT